MTTTLVAIEKGQQVGQIDCAPNIKLTFTYADTWRANPYNFPLSLSMPLAVKTHTTEKVEPFLWGLLPDNDFVIGQWAKKFQVSQKNAFALLSHVGQDCAGAIQLVRPEHLQAIQSGHGDTQWLTETDIADRLKQLVIDHSATRRPRDTGQFSLAGAQPKTALIFQNGKWGVPSGATPTTHILKPPTGEFDGFAENEHFCMELANALGLNTAQSKIVQFKKQHAIVIERYDRIDINGVINRIHQEDFCQALGVSPYQKYQSEGGPDIKNSIELIKNNSSDPSADVETFLKAIALNWLIGGTDAHAKNYSVLIGAQGQVRLAPLYDISSALPYPDIQFQKLRLAMKIGGKYKLQDITVRHWMKQFEDVSYDAEKGRDWLQHYCTVLPDLAHDTRVNIEKTGLKHPILAKLESEIAKRASSCGRQF